MAIKVNTGDVNDVMYNGMRVDVVNYNDVEVWRRSTPPTPMRDVWKIRWYDNMVAVEYAEEEEVIWDVREKVLPISFVSNGGQFGSMSVDFEEAITYGNTMVYETTGGQRGWNYENINYKEIKMYVDPDEVFLDDWANFLNANGLVTHTQEPI